MKVIIGTLLGTVNYMLITCFLLKLFVYEFKKKKEKVDRLRTKKNDIS